MRLIKPFLLLILALVLIPVPLPASEKVLSIIHTNDLHSRLLGHCPNLDYTPSKTGDDQTMGGWARIATVIKSEKEKRQNPTLVLDAGDFLMGSLFHMVSREEGLELRLMKEMGYDVTTLGNHEFDLRPAGLARVLNSAIAKGGMPLIVSSNLIFSKDDQRDDSLQELFDQGIVKKYAVLERGGIRIGLFGLVGKDGAEKAPFAAPVRFQDIFDVSRHMVNLLKEKEKVDLVVCLSHSGLEGGMKSEDVTLAGQVPGIDIIISGHSHTRLLKPIMVNKTIIVQAWAYGKHVGVLDLAIGPEGVRMKHYKIVEVNDRIMGDPGINRRIESYIDIINQKVLAELDLSFYKPVAETDFDLTIETDETNLGNMIADSIRWHIDHLDYNPNDPLSKVRVAVQSNGLIRSPVLVGKTGLVAVCDLFRSNPLGIGWDDTMGYPLITFYVYAAEIKKALEILTTVAPKKGDDYFIQVSGIRCKYNPYRMPFDRVTGIQIEDEHGNYGTLDCSSSNKTLHKVAANIYNATFLKIIGGFTWNILNIVPKDRNGRPITDLGTVRVDADKEKQGLQELKEWKGLMKFMRTFKDTDGDGVPEIPPRYRNKQGRIVKAPSLNPIALVSGGNYVTWLAVGAVVCVLAVLVFIAWFTVKMIRRVLGSGRNHA